MVYIVIYLSDVWNIPRDKKENQGKQKRDLWTKSNSFLYLLPAKLPGSIDLLHDRCSVFSSALRTYRGKRGTVIPSIHFFARIMFAIGQCAAFIDRKKKKIQTENENHTQKYDIPHRFDAQKPP